MNNPTRHALLGFVMAVLGFGSVLPAAANEGSSPKKPNVLIVLVDDAGYGDFGCHGHPFLKTPNIDQLYRESIRWTDFHVAPMCSPTRGQLMTGCHGLRTGVTSVTAGRTFLRPEFATAPQTFAAAGYRTGIFGKWHLGDNYPHRPMDKGFGTAVWTRGWGFTSAPEFSNRLIDGKILRGGKEESFPGYITDFCFDEAMRWMQKSQEEGSPFFCYLPLHAAHAPHVVPPTYSEPYSESAAPDFYGMLANIDENMGKLDAFLHRSGLYDNTVVVFLTDNGGTAGVKVFNAGMRGGKVTYYEGGHRVPCFWRFPAGGFASPGDLSNLTQVQDVLPTLLELCAVPKLAGPVIEGLSLAPLLRGIKNGSLERSLADRSLIVQFGPGFGQSDTTGPKKFDCAILYQRWRLIHGTELYDLEKDPEQKTDVASANPILVAELRKKYESYWVEVAQQLRDFVPIALGAPQENPAVLSCSDWRGIYCDNSQHVRNAVGGPRGGGWTVELARTGDYEIALSRWPFELELPLTANVDPPGKAFDIASARLSIATTEYTMEVPSDAKTAIFNLRLPAGRTQLHGWFKDARGNDLCGAFYARISFKNH